MPHSVSYRERLGFIPHRKKANIENMLVKKIVTLVIGMFMKLTSTGN